MAVAKNEKVYVAGHRGMVGSAVLRALAAKGYQNVVTRTSIELDLRDQAATQAFFAAERPDVVILAAAKVGGIAANQRYPADFIYDNIAIATHVIRSAHNFGVSKLVNLGSSCIYPREAAQPIEETALLTSALESTNRPYAIAKIAAIEMCDSFRTQYGNDFISLMPCNLYGPGDNFDLGTSHVIPALLRKFMIAASEGAESVVVWGTGTPRREFMHVDDMAEACVFCMEEVSLSGPINVGTGHDITVAQLATLIASIVGYNRRIEFDVSKPDGTPRKLLNVSKLSSLGWSAKTPLEKGLAQTYSWLQDMLGEPKGGRAFWIAGSTSGIVRS